MEYYRKIDKRNIKKVFLVITKQCNLSCPFCIRESRREDQELSFDDISNYLKEIKLNFPDAKLIITGGEATLHPDFRKILSESVQLFKKCILCSNGTRKIVFVENSDLLQKCTVQISIDGNEECHDKLRGKGNYKKSRSTIEYLIDKGSNIVIASTISRNNVYSIKEMIDDMIKIGVRNFKISQEMPSGYAVLRGEDHLSTEEWNEFYRECVKFANERDIKISIKKMFPFIGKKLNMKGVTNDMLLMAGCKAGMTQIYIYPDKKVYGCPMLMEYPILNLKTNNISEIEKTSNECKLFQYCLPEDSTCKECQYLNICRGGCPGRTECSASDLWSGDLMCPLIQKDDETKYCDNNSEKKK